jgi:hypothetical protein
MWQIVECFPGQMPEIAAFFDVGAASAALSNMTNL